MAYTNGVYEVTFHAEAGETNIVLTATGDKAFWSPGLCSHFIRAVAAVVTNDVGATGTLNFDKRITAGSDTGRVDNVITALSLTTAHTAGKVVYREGLNVEIKPGEEIVLACDDAAASGDAVVVHMLVEPVYDRPANYTAMVASA